MKKPVYCQMYDDDNAVTPETLIKFMENAYASFKKI